VRRPNGHINIGFGASGNLRHFLFCGRINNCDPASGFDRIDPPSINV
jgi:hypothetical protein